MKKSAQQKLIHDFIAKSREKKLPITPQKIEIFTYIASTTTHPTAKKIWSEVREIFPRISFATVYKNLKNFKKLGFLRETEMPDGTKRYEVDTTPHHHMINLDNGRITDIGIAEIGEISIPQVAEKFELENIQVSFFVRNKK
jgi:Fur family peroxide stress response transcriptional regulator